MDGFGAMFRSDEGCGGSAARELARAADSSRKAVKRAAKEVATAAENVAKAKKNLDTMAKRARVAECSATASAAERDALFSGDATSPRLSERGRLLAAELKTQSTWEHETKVKRLMRHVSSEAKAREKAKDLAKIASDKAEKLTLQRDKARAEKRRSGKKLAKTHAATAKLKNGGSSSATHKLPEAFRARIEAAEADVVVAEADVADISREAAERAAASQEGSGHGLPGGEGAISSYFLKV